MFELDQEQSWVEAKLDEIVFIATSINRPAVAPPDRSPEPAQAYICTIRRGNLFLVHIYLHLISSNIGLLYRWDAGGVPREVVSTLEQNALEFSESMGFMMSDLRYRELSPEEKQGLFESTPLFHHDLSRFKAEEEIQEIEPEEIGETELVIEPIEEPGTESVTEGEFVLGEESAEAQVQPPAEVIPETEPASPAPKPAAMGPDLAGEEVEEILLEGVEEIPEPPPSSAEPSEEDIMLDNLEIKEEQVQASPAPAPVKAAAPEKLKSEEDILLDTLEAQDAGESAPAEPAPPAAPVSPSSGTMSPPAPAQAEPDVVSANLEQTEEITIEGVIEDESPVKEAEVEETTQEMDVPTSAIIAEKPSPVPARVPERVSPKATAVPPSPSVPTEEDFRAEDIQILIRLLAMM
jgi:hypothetical protein